MQGLNEMKQNCLKCYKEQKLASVFYARTYDSCDVEPWTYSDRLMKVPQNDPEKELRIMPCVNDQRFRIKA